MKKFFAILVAVVIGISTMSIPVLSYSYSETKSPYVRSWLDAVNGYEVIDFYEYSSSDNAYYKSAVINFSGNSAYYKTTDTVLTTSLLNEQIGFDFVGNIWYINSNYELINVIKGSKKSESSVAYANELIFDDNNFVIGYYYNNNSYYLSGNSSGNNTNGTNGGNTSWPGSNSGNNWQNGTVTYPYLTIEDQRLTYVESSDQHHQLYIENGYLVLNNLILYKYKVKRVGFTKNGVVYINNDNKLVTYKFGDKKQYVKAKNVTSLSADNDGFIISYTKSNGKTYNL